jgi:hypothetical protein
LAEINFQHLGGESRSELLYSHFVEAVNREDALIKKRKLLKI